jgi:hypothetical protein
MAHLNHQIGTRVRNFEILINRLAVVITARLIVSWDYWKLEILSNQKRLLTLSGDNIKFLMHHLYSQGRSARDAGIAGVLEFPQSFDHVISSFDVLLNKKPDTVEIETDVDGADWHMVVRHGQKQLLDVRVADRAAIQQFMYSCGRLTRDAHIGGKFRKSYVDVA